MPIRFRDNAGFVTTEECVIPGDLRYTAEHEWVAGDGGGPVRVGITHFAQDALGDIVFVQLPEVGTALEEGRTLSEIESTKSVGELFAPVAGTVLEINDAVVAKPELVNSDPFGEGWLIKVSFTELPELLSYDDYSKLTGE